jgi:hypothetical protein
MTRHLVALALAAVIGTSQIVLDLCSGSCEALHIAHTSNTAPACHHSTPLAPRVETVPVGCGHDHHGTTMTAASDASISARMLFVAVLQASNLASAHSDRPLSFVPLVASSPPDWLVQGLTSSLRI